MLPILGSLLLGFVWLRFFRKIDSFEPESWKATFLCLSLGAASPYLLDPIIGLSPFLKSLDGKSTGAALFQFTLFRVAAVEELAKLIPFLGILLMSRWVDESVDYIKYPALSAMGFATAENILYSTSYGVDVLHIRGLLCVSGHIFYTALPGYFLWRSRNQSFLIKLTGLFFGYSLGTICHGAYDFFLFQDENAGTALGLLSVLLCVGFMYAFKRMLIHTLKQSDFYNPAVLETIISAGRSLFFGLAGIFIFIGIAKALQSGQFQAAVSYWQGNMLFAGLGTLVLYGLLALDQKDFRKV
ncbi:MAG TPA: PrsW family glutamic-type intramembrane protease [Catalimonadaceae bacterium]|nr:PrsW family glutamic-type intramembrane protease [Catalimonadaceae bacterium]